MKDLGQDDGLPYRRRFGKTGEARDVATDKLCKTDRLKLDLAWDDDDISADRVRQCLSVCCRCLLYPASVFGRRGSLAPAPFLLPFELICVLLGPRSFDAWMIKPPTRCGFQHRLVDGIP